MQKRSRQDIGRQSEPPSRNADCDEIAGSDEIFCNPKSGERRATRVLGSILLVENELQTARSFSRWIAAKGWEIQTARDVASAWAALSSSFRGLVVDLSLPDGSGFDVIARARESQPDLPVLIVTGCVDSSAINRAQRLRAEYACKPDVAENVRAFLDRCRHAPSTQLTTLVANLSARYGLTPAERRLVLAAAESATHGSLEKRLGVSVNTLKTQIRVVLRRTGAHSMEDLVTPLRALAMRR
jgi:DNA-binding NarL/FixJ family response regulator